MLGYGVGRGKQQNQQTQSSEEELGFGDDGTTADAAKRLSQSQSPWAWQRIKWTDSMVRLLILVVHSVGEDAAVGDSGEQQQKGRDSEAPPGMQQKKGKWKSVSRTMMEKGFYVSPQQCEDKFNDLNKRYKRLNDLVGKGTACALADNPALLDSFAGHLPNKSIEEARKLLSSKHLFFREMCAYHNNASPLHSAAVPAAVQRGADGEDVHHHEYFYVADSDAGEEDYNDESDEEDENGKTMFAAGGGGGRLEKRKAAMWPEASPPLSLTLSSPCGRSPPTPMQQVKRDMIGLAGERQQRQWLRMRAVELEEQRYVYQRRSLQLERQRFRWLRFSSNKELEMERARLRNERRRLENDRLLLLLQQKELALIETPSNGTAV